jgi:hypothetical protein
MSKTDILRKNVQSGTLVTWEKYLLNAFVVRGIAEIFNKQELDPDKYDDKVYQIPYERGRQIGIFLKSRGFKRFSQIYKLSRPTPDAILVVRYNRWVV